MCAKKQMLVLPSGCVLMYDTAGEPARHSVRSRACEQSAYSTEFEVRGATSGEGVPRWASRRAPLAAVAES